MGVMLGWTSGIQVHFCLRLCEWNCTHPYKISSIVRLNNRLEGKVNAFWISKYIAEDAIMICFPRDLCQEGQSCSR